MLVVCSLELSKWASWFLADSYWQRAALALLTCVVELSVPTLLMWRRPARGSPDCRLRCDGITPWWNASLAMGFVLAATALFRPITSRIDAVGESHQGPSGLIAPGVLLAEMLRSIAITPIAEEYLFRGFILGRLQKAMTPKLATLVQAILFAACHAGPIMSSHRLASAFAMGIAFGAWRLRFKGLLPLVVAHGLMNAITYLPSAINEYDLVSLPECRQMEALGHEPPNRAIPLIIEYLGSPDIRVRSGAHAILESRYKYSAGPYLREAMSSDNVDLVQATILLANEHSFPELIPELRRLAWDHRSSAVQTCAVIQMMKLGDASEVASVAADHPLPQVRHAASRLLAKPSILARKP